MLVKKLMDVNGIIAIIVHEANIHDRDGAKLLLPKLTGRLPRPQLIWRKVQFIFDGIELSRESHPPHG
jgi:hypothetical protein